MGRVPPEDGVGDNGRGCVDVDATGMVRRLVLADRVVRYDCGTGIAEHAPAIARSVACDKIIDNMARPNAPNSTTFDRG